LEVAIASLQAHTAASKQPLQAYERFPEPRMAEVLVVKPNKQAIGKTFKKEAKPLQEALEELTQEDAACIKSTYAAPSCENHAFCDSHFFLADIQ
jgi:glycyl-tRNA synthetase